MFKKNLPLISVCIPVFNTETVLERCLLSVITQDFSSFEIIIVSDNSKGKDINGRSCKKIINSITKKTKVPISFIEHNQNRGILEVRRTLFLESNGQYITYVDSDDVLQPSALSTMYKVAISNNADIVHGTSIGGKYNQAGEFILSTENRYSNIFYGTIENQNILHEWIIGKKFTANVWGKLISREVYIKAFNQIPYTTCNLAEDFLMFFFIGFYAKKYVGIKNIVYRYTEEGGMSSGKLITSLEHWNLICSSASVFSIIVTWLEENKDSSGKYLISEEIIDTIKAQTQVYITNCILAYNNSVEDSIKPSAYKMLCNFWGEHFVKTMEEKLFTSTYHK